MSKIALYFFCLVAMSVWVMSLINGVTAAVIVVGLALYILSEGAEPGMVSFLLLFCTLIVHEFYRVLLSPQTMFSKLAPAILAIATNLVWLLIATVVFYGLFWNNGMDNDGAIPYLVCAILIALVNTLTLLFNCALLSKKVRQRMLENYEKMEGRISDQNTTP